MSSELHTNTVPQPAACEAPKQYLSISLYLCYSACVVIRFFRVCGHRAHILLSGSQPLGGYMGKKLYVGNLPFSATDQILTDTFSQCGKVESSKIITDRDTGRSKGFGFVEMSTEAEAQDAISKV